VIDDDREHTESIADALANGGHEIAIAESASEALAIAKRRSPQVVVLDVSLPDANGYEVASALRRDVVPKGVIIDQLRVRQAKVIAAHRLMLPLRRSRRVHR